MYTHRTYRKFHQEQRLVAFQAAVRETDLYIKACRALEAESLQLIRHAREQIEGYIEINPDFLESLRPLPYDDTAPPLVKEMMQAGLTAGVGPMAGVAGAVAEHVGRGLLALSPEVIVENGGDIFLRTDIGVTIDIFAGPSPISQKVGVKLEPVQMPIGVCTSSGTVGPSLSFGNADAVTVLSPSTTLADAMATAIANTIHVPNDVEQGLDRARTTPGITAALIIIEDRLGVWGDVELVRL